MPFEDQPARPIADGPPPWLDYLPALWQPLVAVLLLAFFIAMMVRTRQRTVGRHEIIERPSPIRELEATMEAQAMPEPEKPPSLAQPRPEPKPAEESSE